MLMRFNSRSRKTRCPVAAEALAKQQPNSSAEPGADEGILIAEHDSFVKVFSNLRNVDGRHTVHAKSVKKCRNLRGRIVTNVSN
ncbi:hypothetical protein [Parahaliea aestuarii]|uniref:hypothetical protein n=1 Tax=Parahaliea aestuarii TaxID=1852021 RepID=UPI001650A859|nr:hypothetical protein [Parahaliea aestuarii]